MTTLRLGTRGSDLALVQTELVRSALLHIDSSLTVEIVVVKTTGDRRQGTPEAALNDKKAWILELEEAVADGEIDFAVHSGKDVPFEIHSGTSISSILPRATPNDAFIGAKQKDGSRLRFSSLPASALIGTSSLRRQAMLRNSFSSCAVTDMRGNVPTRIRKLDESSELSGIVVATAGLERLDLPDVEFSKIPEDQLVPALAQGTLVAQFQSDNSTARELALQLAHEQTEAGFQCERACGAVLEADCSSAVGVLATVEQEQIRLIARVLQPDGSQSVEVEFKGTTGEASALGEKAGRELLDQGAGRFL